MKTHKKAQLQTMETIAVLFIFFILLGFSLVFFATLQKSKANSQISELHRIESSKIAQSVINMQEIRASRRGIKGVNTIDEIKLQAFSKVVSEDFELRKGYYEEKLGSSTIIVSEVYPGENEWVIYDNSPTQYKSVFNYFVPVSLFNPMNLPSGNYSVGLLQIQYYS